MAKNPNRNGSKDKGTRGETGVVRKLWELGMTDAKRVLPEMGHDLGDVSTDRIAWQVKAGDAAMRASEEQIRRWMIDTETQAVHAGADFGVLVTARQGYSPARAEFWWSWLPTRDVIELTCPVQTRPPFGDTSVLDYPVRYPLYVLVGLLKVRGYSAKTPVLG